MVFLKVQYDAYNRQFKLCDNEQEHVLDDGETYLLIADVSVENLDLAPDPEISSVLEPVLR